MLQRGYDVRFYAADDPAYLEMKRENAELKKESEMLAESVARLSEGEDCILANLERENNELKKTVERTRKGIMKCARWLSDCISFGWKKSQLDMLEELFWKYHDGDGNLIEQVKELNGEPL